MSEARKTAAMQNAEKLMKKPDPTYAQEAAVLDKQRRAEDEKTARLRALRLAKEAADAKEAEAAKAQSKPASGKRKKAAP